VILIYNIINFIFDSILNSNKEKQKQKIAIVARVVAIAFTNPFKIISFSVLRCLMQIYII
jgi:hypothetical protein